MAQNTGRHSRIAAEGQADSKRGNMWTRRDASAGKFLEAKGSGGSFGSIKRRPTLTAEGDALWAWIFATLGSTLLLGGSIAHDLFGNVLDFRGAGVAAGAVSFLFAGLFLLRVQSARR